MTPTAFLSCTKQKEKKQGGINIYHYIYPKQITTLLFLF